jgi:hypothetical protein
MIDPSSPSSPHDEERKVVLTIGGTYGRKRHASPHVTLTVPYHRLSYTLQQIHRQGGQVLDIAIRSSPFPTVAFAKTLEPNVSEPNAPRPNPPETAIASRSPESPATSMPADRPTQNQTAPPAEIASKASKASKTLAESETVAEGLRSPHLSHRQRYERSPRARRQLRQYLRRSQPKPYHLP